MVIVTSIILIPCSATLVDKAMLPHHFWDQTPHQIGDRGERLISSLRTEIIPFRWGEYSRQRQRCQKSCL